MSMSCRLNLSTGHEVSVPLGTRTSHAAATPALSMSRGPSNCTLQPNKSFVVVHQLPHGHRLSNTLKRIFWRPISQFVLFTVTLTLKIPINFCRILKKVICVILYVLICFGTGAKDLVLKAHHVGVAICSSFTAYSKSETVLDTPTKRSQGTDTHSLITGKRHKNKRTPHNSSYIDNVNSKNNRSSNNSKFSKNRNLNNNDESAEEHADPGDEKDSPHLYETQEEQTSRTSTPELLHSKLPGMGRNGRSDSTKTDKNKQRVKTNRKQKVSGGSENVFMDNRVSEIGGNIGRFSAQERNDSPIGSFEGDSCSAGSEGGYVFDDDDEVSVNNYDRNSESNGDGKNHNSCMYNEANSFQSQSNGGSRFSRFSNGPQYDDSINEGVRHRKQNLFWQEHEQKSDFTTGNNGSSKRKKSNNNTPVTGGAIVDIDSGCTERRNSDESCEQNATSAAGEDIDAPPGFEGFLSNVISRPQKRFNANERYLGSEHASYHHSVVSNSHPALPKVPSVKTTTGGNKKEMGNANSVISIGGATNTRKHHGVTRIGNTCNLSRTNSGSSLSDFTAPLATPIGLANFRKAKEEFLRSDTAATPTVKMGPTLKSAHLRMSQNDEGRPSALPFKNNWRIAAANGAAKHEQHRHDFSQSAPFSFNRDRYLPGVNIGDSLFGGGGGNSPLPCSTEHSNYGSNEQLGGAENGGLELRQHKYSNIQINSSWPPESQSSSPATTSCGSNAEKSPVEKSSAKKESKFCKIFKENSAAESSKNQNESGHGEPSSQRPEKLLGDAVYGTSPGVLWNSDAIALGKSDSSPGSTLWNTSLMPYLEESQPNKTDDPGFKKQQKHLSRIWEQDMPSPLSSPVNNDGDLSGPLRSMGGPSMYADSLPTLFENPFSPTSISDLWKPLSLGRASPESAWGARRMRSAAFPVAPFDEDKEDVVAKEKEEEGEEKEKEKEKELPDEKVKKKKGRAKEEKISSTKT